VPTHHQRHPANAAGPRSQPSATTRGIAPVHAGNGPTARGRRMAPAKESRPRGKPGGGEGWNQDSMNRRSLPRSRAAWKRWREAWRSARQNAAQRHASRSRRDGAAMDVVASGSVQRSLCYLVRSTTVTAPTTTFQKAPRRRGKLRLPPRRSSIPCPCFVVESSYPTAPRLDTYSISVVAMTGFRPGPLRQHQTAAVGRPLSAPQHSPHSLMRQLVALFPHCRCDGPERRSRVT
jgi:hypothetical protein